MLNIKEEFNVKLIKNSEAKPFVSKYHYLGVKKYSCVKAFGLYRKDNNELLGCAIFGQVSSATAIKGWFGFGNERSDIIELTRLVMHPTLNQTNATSYLLSHSLRQLKSMKYSAVITMADASKHIGYIYQACNFKYYGVSKPKTDFFALENPLYPYKKKTTNVKGVWLPRSLKYRYCYLLDKELNVLFEEQPYPKGKEFLIPQCCNGAKLVRDKRSNSWYTCPRCSTMIEFDKYIKDVYDKLIEVHGEQIHSEHKNDIYRKIYSILPFSFASVIQDFVLNNENDNEIDQFINSVCSTDFESKHKENYKNFVEAMTCGIMDLFSEKQ